MRARITFVLMAIFALTSSSALGQSFQGLGFLPGGPTISEAYGLSADGSTVVGFQYAPGMPIGGGFRWTQAGGLQSLGAPPGENDVFAFGVSADGSVIVGISHGPGQDNAFRWTQAGGHELIGGENSGAWGVSGDGQTVVGFDGGNRVWRAGEGWTALPVLPGYDSVDTFFSAGVSADGSVIASSVYNASTSINEAARWTPSGVQGLGFLPGYESSQTGLAGLSSDGSTVVGYGFTGTSGEAFRWTEFDGMVSLGDLPGGDTLSIASAVSGDGSIVVGRATDEQGEAAFIWDETYGMRSLQDVLADVYGLNLDGWWLTRARGISDDGLTIAGIGINPLGQQEAWIATVPEPSTTLLLGFGVLGLVRRRRLDVANVQMSKRA